MAVAVIAADHACAQCTGWPVTCTGITPTSPAMPGGGLNGFGAAATGLGIGLTRFNIINQMNQPQAVPASPSAAAPASTGSYAASPPWNPAVNPPANSYLTLQQKSAILNQLRPLGTGSYTAKRNFLSDKEKVVDFPDRVSKGLDAWDFAETKDKPGKFWDGLNRLLGMSLGDKTVQAFLKIGPGFGNALSIANLILDATYDVSSEYQSWKALEELNRGSEKYLQTAKNLQKKITDTVRDIKNVRNAIGTARQSSDACATSA